MIVRLSVSIFDLRDPTVIIVSVLLLSLTFTPINKRILSWIDETFYPEKTKYAEALKKYIHKISGQIESKELLLELKRLDTVNHWDLPCNPIMPSGNQLSLQSTI